MYAVYKKLDGQDQVLEWRNECIMCLKVLIGDKLVTCICAYASQTGRSAEEKDSF